MWWTMEIKFRNALNIKFSNALLASFSVIILYLIGLVFQLIFKDWENNILALEIFGVILLSIWTIFFLCAFVFHRTVKITEEQIALYKRKKIIWAIKKEDILECVYAKFFINKSYYPDAGDMSFKLKPIGRLATRKLREGIYTNMYIGISYTNVKKMMDLGYTVRISNSINNDIKN